MVENKETCTSVYEKKDSVMRLNVITALSSKIILFARSKIKLTCWYDCLSLLFRLHGIGFLLKLMLKLSVKLVVLFMSLVIYFLWVFP